MYRIHSTRQKNYHLQCCAEPMRFRSVPALDSGTGSRCISGTFFFHVKISFELLIISEERKLQIEFCLGQVKSTFSERIVALNPPFFGFKTFLNIGQTYGYIAVYFTWSRREAGRHASRRSLLLLHCFLLYKIGRSTYGVKYRRNETNWPST